MKNWLDKYNDGGPVQPNYNDASVSYPPNFVGQDYDTTGRNYSPAWGGQFEDGGQLPQFQPGGKTPIIVSDKNDPRLKAYNDSLSSWKSGHSFDKLKSLYTGAIKNSYDLVTDPKRISRIKSIDSKVQPTAGLFFNTNKFTNSYLSDKPTTHFNPDPDKAKVNNWKKAKDDSYYNNTGAMVVADLYSFKKPTQPIVYQERTYQTETPELQPLPIQGMDASLPDLQRVEGPSKWMRSFGAGADQNYWSKVDAYGLPLPGYVAPNQNAVAQPQGPGPEFAMGGSMPGAVGFTYARTGDIPSNGPYAKKTKASAQDGTQIKTNVPVPIDEIKQANSSAEAFNKQYVQSPNYINLLKKQGYSPEEIKKRQDSVLGMTNDDYTYTNFGPNYVYDDEAGKTKIQYNQQGLGDWSNFGDIAAHEWGHVGVTRFGEDALKPSEQHMLISRLNMKNVSGDENAAEHDMAPQENRADLVELRKALQDRGIYDSFKGGKFKQKHLNQLRDYKGDEDEYWNRSMRLYKDKDIIKLMNTIAANDPQEGAPTAQNGGKMTYYQNGLDFKPKSISKNGSVIKDDMGQWAHPGKVTQIGSNQITMQGVPYPVLGISDTGDMQMMYPNQEYNYHGSSVTEYPMMAQGGQLTKLDQLTNFTNYNTKQPGGWLDKYQ